MEDFYKLLHPCMTILVVSVSENGRPNAMTCAWNMPVSEEPPLIAVALSRESYTNELIRKCHEFTVNIPDENLLKAIWICGTKSGRRADKSTLAGFHYSPSRRVKPPIIEECLAHLECRLEKLFEVGECTLFVGEVLEAYASEEAFSSGVWRIGSVNLPMHLGGELFAIPTKVVRARAR